MGQLAWVVALTLVVYLLVTWPSEEEADDDRA
jgi:hypothetical protein